MTLQQNSLESVASSQDADYCISCCGQPCVGLHRVNASKGPLALIMFSVLCCAVLYCADYEGHGGTQYGTKREHCRDAKALPPALMLH
jgi:hypothetical protein